MNVDISSEKILFNTLQQLTTLDTTMKDYNINSN